MSWEGEKPQRAFPMWDAGSLCAVVAGTGSVHTQSQPSWGSGRGPGVWSFESVSLGELCDLGQTWASLSLS